MRILEIATPLLAECTLTYLMTYPTVPRPARDRDLRSALYAQQPIHELPFAYNANADANLTRASWAQVHILHDLIVQRKRGWARSGHAALVEDLTREARRSLVVGASPIRPAMP